MANLTEQEKWETGIYQIEESDPVHGGEDGITNKPIRQLANRTLYLKKELEKIASSSDNTGVTAGTYRSVTVDAKGLVTDGQPVKIGLITATSSKQVKNEVTGNHNTYINVYERVDTLSTVSTSTQVTGTGTVTVSSDDAGKLIIAGADSIPGNAATASRLTTERNITLTGAVTGSAKFDGSKNISIVTTDNRKIGQDLIRYYSSIPASKQHNGDVICVFNMRRLFYWQKIGAFTGYASTELGHGIFSSSKTPLPGTVLADGRSLPVASYKALYEYAKVNGLFVGPSLWRKGAFCFVDQKKGNFKIPDMRGQFVRAVGADADNANAMVGLGAFQGDAIRNIKIHLLGENNYSSGGRYDRGEFYSSDLSRRGIVFGSDGSKWVGYNELGSEKYGPYAGSYGLVTIDLSEAAPTSSENRPCATSFNYYIYAY